MTTYTIGEIYRKKLLRNRNGEAYKDKATVSKELKGKPYTTKQTPHGESKLFSQAVLDSLNQRWN